ncbi:hypothetical protein [Nocardia niigatensis]|uniref:hypothetical protein n=1 Tax=Nocardia niigatensis TaxID=209249 RepID=UPI0002E1B3BB|nr:hypothetical protein [Nocardia niigatensis]
MAGGGRLHAYIDESGRSGKDYVMCAVTITSSDSNPIKKELIRLCPKGSLRIHMNGVERRLVMPIINGVAALEATSRLIVATNFKTVRQARDCVLTRTFEYLQTLNVDRVIIETCKQDHEDNKIIRSVLGADPPMHYQHERPDNPLLWLPDVHAWAWGKGGKYRTAIAKRIDGVERLRPS